MTQMVAITRYLILFVFRNMKMKMFAECILVSVSVCHLDYTHKTDNSRGIEKERGKGKER